MLRWKLNQYLTKLHVSQRCTKQYQSNVECDVELDGIVHKRFIRHTR